LPRATLSGFPRVDDQQWLSWWVQVTPRLAVTEHFQHEHLAHGAPDGRAQLFAQRRGAVVSDLAFASQAARVRLPQSPEPKENFMAVQQNKKSPSKRGMHRSHNALVTPGTAIEPTTGEVHLRHHISPTGFYRGRKVLKTKADA